MDFDASKENILPLPGGRRAEQLEIALNQEKYHDKLLEQRKEHEMAIENYEGDDPLDPWFDYIFWIEQSFPKGGKESSLDEVIIKCIETFQNDERYRQDRRMVKIYMKFIDTRPNPTDFYQELYNEGIGTMVADLYIGWAYYYDAMDNFKQTEAIYRKGLDARAQPLEDLENAHKHFGFSMSQRILYKDEPENQQQFASALQERRSALTSLRAHKKKHVGTTRIGGGAIKSSIPGKVNQENVPNNSQKPVQVYVGDEVAAVQRNESVIGNLLSTERERENTHEPGPWNKAKLGKSGSAVSASTSKLTFSILEDDNKFSPIVNSVETYENGIKLPKKFYSKNKPQTLWDIQVVLEENIPPNVLPMYSKTYLYPAPGQEYSTEELRGYNWFKKKEIKNKFTQKYDTIWAEDASCPCRMFPNFATFNLKAPQMEDIEQEEIPEVPLGLMVGSVEISFEELKAKRWLENPHRAENSDLMEETLIGENRRVSIHPLRLTDYRKSVAPPSRKSVAPLVKQPRVSLLSEEAEEEEETVAKPVQPQPNFKPRDSIQLYKEKVKNDDFQNLFQSKRKAENDAEVSNKNPCSMQTPKKSFNDFAVPKIPAKSLVCVPDEPEEPPPYAMNANETLSTQNFNFDLKPYSVSTPIIQKTVKRINEPLQVPPENCQENISPAQRPDQVESPVESPAPSTTMPQKQLSTIMETTEPTSSTGINTKSTISSPESDQECVQKLVESKSISTIGFQIYEDKTENLHPVPSAMCLSVSRPNLTVPMQQDFSLKPVESFQVIEQITASKFSIYEDDALKTENLKVPEVSDFESEFMKSPAKIRTIKLGESSKQNDEKSKFSIFKDKSADEYPSINNKSKNFSLLNRRTATSEEPTEKPEIEERELQTFKDKPTIDISIQNKSKNFSLLSGKSLISEEPSVPTKTSILQSSKGFEIFKDESLKNDSVKENRKKFSIFGVSSSKIVPEEPKDASATQTVEFQVFEDDSPKEASIKNKSKKFSLLNIKSSITEESNDPSNLKQTENLEPKDFDIFMDSPPKGGVINDESKQFSLSIKNSAQTFPEDPKDSLVLGETQTITEKFEIFKDKSQKEPETESNEKTVNSMMKDVSLHHADPPKTPFKVFQETEKPKNVSRISENDDFYHFFAKTPEKADGFNVQLHHDTLSSTQALLKMNVNEIETPAVKREPSLHIQDEIPCTAKKIVEPQYRSIFTEDDQINTLLFKPDNNSTLITPWKPPFEVKEDAAKQVENKLSLSLNDDEETLLGEPVAPCKLVEFVAPTVPAPRRLTKVRKSRYSVAPLPAKSSMVESVEDDLGMSIYEETEESYEITVEDWPEDSVENGANLFLQKTVNFDETAALITEKLNEEFINPFDHHLIAAFLDQVEFCSYLERLETCSLNNNRIGPLTKGTNVTVGNNKFEVLKAIGKGAYGTVYKGKCKSTGNLFALKQERPANLWEYYICLEIRHRITNPDIIPGYMNIEYALIGNNSSVIVSEYSKFGTLIDVCNKVKRNTGRNVEEFVVMILIRQILNLIDHLHSYQIIHADIKPDNFLLMAPLELKNPKPVVQIIDFGVSIDMKLMPPRTTFKLVEEENPCIEMREGKPWTYQVDLYGIAGIAHAMLFGKYIEVEKKNFKWGIKTRLPRYFNKEIWEHFFESLLNIRNCNEMPNLQNLRASFEEEIVNKEKIVENKIREFNLALLK